MTTNGPAPRRAVTPPTDEELLHAVPRGQINREFQVGVFVILGVASVLLALFLLTDPSTFRGRYLVTTEVEDAGGIRRGDPVQMKGVNIGRVQGFSLEPGGVLITLELEGEWRIPVDSRTQLVSSGILGGRTVEVVSGTSSQMLRAGGSLPGANMPGLLDFPPELGQSAEEVLGRIQTLLDDPTVEAVQSGAVELRALLARLSSLADEQGEEVARLTASLNRSAQGLETAAGSGEDFARAVARADSALATAQETSRSLRSASASLETILQRMEAGEGTLGQLSTDSTLYETLASAAESIRALAEDLRLNPGRYVKIEIF
jgi:phospholipid/cholesterol/gamma-HCH transport system substrate-binding protein